MVYQRTPTDRAGLQHTCHNQRRRYRDSRPNFSRSLR
jgi:hypothetical protein